MAPRNGTAAPVMDPAFEILPPHHDEAEESVLGSLLIDPDAISAIPTLEPDDFYHARNRDIFRAMAALHERGIPTDFVMVSEELERTDLLDPIGGIGYLSRILTIVPTSIHVEHYAGIVARTAAMRRLIQAGGQIATLGYQDTDDLDATFARAEQLVRQATKRVGTGAWLSIGEALTSFTESIDLGTSAEDGAPVQGTVPTGYFDLDRLLGGLHAGDLIVLAARPSMGKTSLGLNIARDVAVRQRLNVGLFSLEMSRLQLAGRLLASEAQVDVARLREGRISQTEVRQLGEAFDQLRTAPLWLDDTSGLSLRELEIRARRLHADHPLSLLVVDYLGLVRNPIPGQGRVQEVGAISRSLKGLAGELGCPVLALSQLNRAVESRNPKIPMLADLRDSGDVEQDSDVVIFIYREDMYDRETERKGMADLIVAKARNGPTGIVPLLFLDRTAQFVNLGRL